MATQASPRPRLVNYVAALLAVLVSGVYLTGDVGRYFYVAAAAMIGLAVALIFAFRPFNIGRAVLGSALCVGPPLVSLLMHQGGMTSVIPLLALVAFAICAYGLGAAMTAEELRTSCVRAAPIALVLFAVATVAHGWDMLRPVATGRRLMIEGIQPNLFALGAAAAFMLGSNCRKMTVALVILAGALIPALAASARGAMLMMLVVLLVSRLTLLERKSGIVLALGAMAAAATVALLVFQGPLMWLADLVFHVNDQYRGMGTAASGRSVIWSYFLENWAQHPWLGTGPGSTYLAEGRAYYSHNLVLQLLTDGGLIGLLTFGGFLTYVAVAGSSARIGPTASRTLLIALTAYLVYGLFEGRAVNIGNPLSAAFFFVVFAVFAKTEVPAHAVARPARRPIPGLTINPPAHRWPARGSTIDLGDGAQ